ncbi:MAG: TIGR03790 family protein [Phycisphaerae bacterium]
MKRQANRPKAWGLLMCGTIVVALTATSAIAIDPQLRTADMPDSWLVLYNLNDPDSISWAQWYTTIRGIPATNMLGLDADLTEHLATIDQAQNQIITPVRDLFTLDTDFEQQTMGIILGYGLPGHYETLPAGLPDVGGFSIADALQDMWDDFNPAASQRNTNVDNPHAQQPPAIIPAQRLTKATLKSGRYLVARIDGPTMQDAQALTQRALTIENSIAGLGGENVSYDYFDTDFPSSTNEWFWLKAAVQSPDLADIPWVEFDLDGQSGPTIPSLDAFRFSIYQLFGWSPDQFVGDNPGSQIMAFHFNSFGAVTLRSTTLEGALYVPNALAAGYAASIGATGEPICCVGPFPDTILASMREGWTLGEAFYLANPFNDWMWTLVGDPFLTVPYWFNEIPPIIQGDGDINADGTVDGLDILPFTDVLLGLDSDPLHIASADLDGNGLIDDDDAYLLLGPLVYGAINAPELKGTGDANGDRQLNGLDIDAYLDMLFNGTNGWPLRARWGADMNQDDMITVEDAPLLADVLIQS